MEFSVSGGADAPWIDSALLREEMHGRQCACCGKFPVARKARMSRWADRHVIGVANHLNHNLRMLRENCSDLLHYGLAVRLQHGFSRVEHHVIQNVYRQLAL